MSSDQPNQDAHLPKLLVYVVEEITIRVDVMKCLSEEIKGAYKCQYLYMNNMSSYSGPVQNTILLGISLQTLPFFMNCSYFIRYSLPVG